MSERDELARLIFVADNWNQSESDSLNDWAAWTDGGKDSYTHRTADSILAAGYQKPRTVATIDELAKLPADSVILTHKGGVFAKHFDHFREQDNWEARGAGSVWPEDLPATVLYEPS